MQRSAWATLFPSQIKKTLRELYKKEGIWAKVKRELEAEGRLEAEKSDEKEDSGCCGT